MLVIDLHQPCMVVQVNLYIHIYLMEDVKWQTSMKQLVT